MKWMTKEPTQKGSAAQRKSDASPLVKQFKQGFGRMPIQAQIAMLKPGAPVPPPKASPSTRSLDTSVQSKAERSLGEDFSGVLVHHGDGVAESFQARAVTMGSDIHVAAQASPQDVTLMGHELTHVIQQGASGGIQTKSQTVTPTNGVAQSKSHNSPQTKDGGGPPARRHEVEADQAGAAVAQGKSFTVQTRVTSAGVTPQFDGPESEHKGSWASFFQGEGGNYVRMGLEVVRVFPGYGLYAGVAADFIEGYQNITAAKNLKGEDAQLLASLATARQIALIIKNAIDHCTYCVQLTQDGVVVSVVGAEIAAVTAPLQEGLEAFSLGMGIGEAVLDLVIAVIAERAAASAPNDEAYNEYISFANTFYVNAGTSILGSLISTIDLISGGLANLRVFQNFANFVKMGAKTYKPFAGAVLGVINNWLGIWTAGKVLDPIRHEPTQPSIDRSLAPEREEAGGRIREELDEIEPVAETGQGLIDRIVEAFEGIGEDIEAMVMEFTDGKSPFEFFRDKIAEGIEEFSAQVAEFLAIKATAEDIQAKAEEYKQYLEEGKAAVEGIALPEIPDPEPADYGDSWLANAAEWVSDTASSAAAAAVSFVRNQLQEVVELATSTVAGLIDGIISQMDGFAEFIIDMIAAINNQIEQAQQKAEELSAELAQAEGIGDIVEILWGAVTEFLGSTEEETNPEGLQEDASEVTEGISEARSEFSES